MEIAKNSLKEVILGIWIIAAIVILAGVFFVSNPIAYVLGQLVGSLTATLMMIHLYRSIDVELDLPEKKAVNHAKLTSALRSVIELLVLAGSFYVSQWIFPLTVLAGLLSRKFAALLVPWMEKVRNIDNKAEE